MKRPTAEYLDFEDFVGWNDAVYKSTRGDSECNLSKKTRLGFFKVHF
jgi:hypothetical protein